MTVLSYQNKRNIIPFFVGNEKGGLMTLMTRDPEFIQNCVTNKGYKFVFLKDLISWANDKILSGCSSKLTSNTLNDKILSDLDSHCPKQPGIHLLYLRDGESMIYPFQSKTVWGARLELKKFVSTLTDIKNKVDENPFIEDYSQILKYQIEIERQEEKRRNEGKKQKEEKSQLEKREAEITTIDDIKNEESSHDSGIRLSVVGNGYRDDYQDMFSRLASTNVASYSNSRPKSVNPVVEGEPKVRKMLELARELFELGFSLNELNSLLGLVKVQPVPIEVSLYGKINLVIGDTRKEITMTPMSKALYILYLKHPEGIRLKELSDYKKEIAQIYSRIARYDNPNTIEESIDNLLNPLRNTANENICRIKSAFFRHLDPSEAEPYLIIGPQGEKKAIKLDRSLVKYIE